MLDIQKLQNCGFFQPLELSTGDFLFKQGTRDNNIYIIISGELEIQKYTDITHSDSKQLARLRPTDVFGEAALSNNYPKNVAIRANQDTKLIKIDAGEEFEKFLQQQPELCLNLLKKIIESSNKRVLRGNKIITATAEVSKKIRELHGVSYKSIFEVLNNTRLTIPCNRIIYIEKNQNLDTYYVVRYDTKTKNRLLGEVIETNDFTLGELSEKYRPLEKFNAIQKLEIGCETLGYLVFCRKGSDFVTDDLKILSSIAPLFAGVLKQKKVIDENK